MVSQNVGDEVEQRLVPEGAAFIFKQRESAKGREPYLFSAKTLLKHGMDKCVRHGRSKVEAIFMREKSPKSSLRNFGRDSFASVDSEERIGRNMKMLRLTRELQCANKSTISGVGRDRNKMSSSLRNPESGRVRNIGTSEVIKKYNLRDRNEVKLPDRGNIGFITSWSKPMMLRV